MSSVISYQDILNSVISNREDPKDEELQLQFELSNILLGNENKEEAEENAKFFRNMLGEDKKITFQDLFLCPAHRTIRQRLESENQKLQYNFVGTGIFECRKCKSKKTSHVEKQVRSADEPMNVFVKCHKCGHSWKQ
jgi:DNA-directed RNA polymerase subunit M/transcription elongation factor TFIIS